MLDGLEVEVAQDHSEEGDDRGGEGAEIVTLYKTFCHFVILSFWVCAVQRIIILLNAIVLVFILITLRLVSAYCYSDVI